MLAFTMLIFTLYYEGINLRCFGLATQILKGKYLQPGARGELTPFQALATAISGTVGLGNIAGVAIAIGLGGPGAVFWMFIVGFFAMTTKFAECTLGVKYRLEHHDGSVSGGPMVYLERGLANRNLPGLGKFLALLYSVPMLCSSFTFFQVNQASQQFKVVTGYEQDMLFSIVFGLMTAVVVIGGLKSIAQVTSRLVPLMCGIYLVATVIVIGANLDTLPVILMSIIDDAFSPGAVEGGIIGVLIIGMRRAIASSEAGLGSSTIAHAAAITDKPVSEGLVALYEPFVDTVVICTLTGLVILITNAHLSGEEGVAMTSVAFASMISWFPWILAITVLLFAYSTVISWCYYGEKVCVYLFGYHRYVVMLWRVLYCVVTPCGALITSSAVIAFLDSMYFLMAVPNLIGLYIMAPEVKEDLKKYLKWVSAQPA